MSRLLLLTVLITACNTGCEDWNQAFERMVDQPKYESYEESTFFDDQRTMRAPPLGAVAREATLGPLELVSGFSGGAAVERAPIPVTLEQLARGRDRFGIYCAVCHGTAGDGNSVVAANMQLRPPPSLHEEHARALKIGDLYRTITLGYGLMPSYREQLSIEERWAVAAYVQALQLSQGVPISSLPTAVREEAMQSLK